MDFWNICAPMHYLMQKPKRLLVTEYSVLFVYFVYILFVEFFCLNLAVFSSEILDQSATICCRNPHKRPTTYQQPP